MANPLGKGPMVPGNKIWQLRPYNAGPERLLATPQDLIGQATEYFEWADANPREEEIVGWYQGDAGTHTKEHERAYTIAGLCAWLGVNRTTWGRWKTEREDLLPAILWVEAIMYEQKFTAAAAGLMNANIIARDLGLAEISDHTSSDGSMTPKPNVIEFQAPQLETPEPAADGG